MCVPGGGAGDAVVVDGEAYDELSGVEGEAAGGVEVAAAVVGREAHAEVGRAVEADQLGHDGPVHAPRPHLRRDLDLQDIENTPPWWVSLSRLLMQATLCSARG